jgi:sugar phosphate permease
VKLVFLVLATQVLSSAGLAPPDTSSQRAPRVNSMPSNYRRHAKMRELVSLRDSTAAAQGEIDQPSKQERFRRRGMAAALFSTYFTVMGAKCALPSVLSQLTAPKIGLSFVGWTSKPQTLMAQQLTLATFAVALGKLLLGPVIDRFGGVLSLQACLTVLMLMLGIIASSSSFMTFAVAWLVVDFVFSSCWAGCINAVHQNFPEKEWAKRIGMIAAAARTGNASAFVIFAAVLQWCNNHLPADGQPWRLVFGASAALQVVSICLLAYFGRIPPENLDGVIEEKKEEEAVLLEVSPKKKKSSLSTLRKEALKPEFWLHLMSRSALMVYGSFLLFVPTLMSQVYGLSNSQAAQVGSILAIGCLVSVTTCSQLYATLAKKKRIIGAISMCSLATLCALVQLAHTSGRIVLSPGLSALSMFLWGFSFAVPFYIPPSMFALARGGKESSATISDVFDIAGFGLLAVFNGYVASIRHSSLAAWVPTFQALAGCSLVSLVSLSLAIFFE